MNFDSNVDMIYNNELTDSLLWLKTLYQTTKCDVNGGYNNEIDRFIVHIISKTCMKTKQRAHLRHLITNINT